MKEFASFRLDTANECLWHGSEEIALPPKPYAVLRYLVEHAGRLITHDELLDALWPETYVQPQVLRTYVLDLRKILGDDSAQPRFIQTLPKRGYCFIAPVTESNGAVPALPGSAPAGRIVGRDAEWSRLEAELNALNRGERRIVFVTGEPGIGKTALVDTFLGQLKATERAVVARGQCVEGFAASEDYYPVMEGLQQLCASPHGELACRALARVAAPWLSALGRSEPPTADAPAKQGSAGRVPGDLCAALEEIAAEHPLVLVLEDLQWADDASLKLISALARRRAPARLMVLITCGLAEPSSQAGCRGLKQDLLLRQLASEIVLAPLPRGAVSLLVQRELKQEKLPAGLAAFVHQHSEGNPLFTIAIVEHLVAQGFLVREQAGTAEAWKAASSFEEMEARVPEGLAQMIELEMERLQPEEHQLLEAASLMGIAFPAWAVAAALQKEESAVEEECQALSRRLYFVKRAGEDELPDGSRSDFYVFVHGLYRQMLYQRQSATRRATRHRRIAVRLGELFAGREASVAREQAKHYEAAGDWLGAALALRSAAHHARQRQAEAEAVELLEHALRLTAHLSGAERDALTRDLRKELAQADQSGSAVDCVKVS